MAIDSRAKSRSAIHFLMPFYPATGEPGGGIDQADSQESAWSYRGILAGAVAVIAGRVIALIADKRVSLLVQDARVPSIITDSRTIDLVRG